MQAVIIRSPVFLMTSMGQEHPEHQRDHATTYVYVSDADQLVKLPDEEVPEGLRQRKRPSAPVVATQKPEAKAAVAAEHRLFGGSFKAAPTPKKLNILVTGGKMSKASAVARAVGRHGHKVVTAEIMPYKFCRTCFCSYVSAHYVLPRPTVEPAKWESTIMSIVEAEDTDLIIPCTAPVESSAYAHLAKRLPAKVKVFAFDAAVTDELDNKFTFNQVLVKAGLPCPETAKMECLEDALQFFEGKSTSEGSRKYIVKPAVYDPKARTEILFLPIEDEKQLEYLKSRNASKQVPYVIQEVLQNPEYGCYALYNKGALTGFEFFESAASCLRYRQESGKNYDDVKNLCAGLGKAMNLTGQLTLDLMHNSDGAMVTRIWVWLSLTRVFLRAGFWKHKNCFKLSLWEMLCGTDALLHGDDPLPFLTMYLVQIPSLLLLELVAGTPWLKIDFCIGKIVKEGTQWSPDELTKPTNAMLRQRCLSTMFCLECRKCSENASPGLSVCKLYILLALA
eukprot:s314_g32.t4